MTRKLMSIIIALILIGVVAGVVIISDFNDNYTEFVPLTSVSGFVDTSNEFAFDMYGKLATGNDNVFFSPYSITTGLSMAYEGARGQTAQEMADVLGIPEDNQTRWDLMWSYQGYFNHENPYYDLSTANAYWLAENADLREEYRTTLESYYLAHGEELDFAGDKDVSIDKINSWIEDETNGKITDMLSSDDIDVATYMVLTNAIYFNAKWKYEFNPDDTMEEEFNRSNGEKTVVDMMFLDCDHDVHFSYMENEDIQFMKLPYKNEEMSMYILLPKWNDITYIESMINNSYINNLKGNMELRNLFFYLPRFKMTQDYNLNHALENMGMPTALSADADFTGITDSVPLSIENALHQSHIEVNEEGTEAAATFTANPLMGSSGRVFNANHPFIFFIEHEETGQILFMGKVENPLG